MNKMYRVTGIERLRFSMEIKSETKSEAKRKFDAYISKGACDRDSIGVSTKIEEIKEGGTK